MTTFYNEQHFDSLHMSENTQRSQPSLEPVYRGIKRKRITFPLGNNFTDSWICLHISPHLLRANHLSSLCFSEQTSALIPADFQHIHSAITQRNKPKQHN